MLLAKLEGTGLKEKSIKLYKYQLKQIMKAGFDLSSENKVKDNKEGIVEYIKNVDKSNDTKLALLNSLLKVIDEPPLVAYFKEVRAEFNRLKADGYKNNRKDKDFVEYDKLLDLTKEPYDNDSFMTYFSVRYPIRLSLWNIRLTAKLKGNDPKLNWLYLGSVSSRILMNDFKNVAKMGPVEIIVSKEDDTVLRKYISTLPKKAEFLFYKKNGLPYKGTGDYARCLTRILKKLTTKSITMNDIRYSYESNLINSDKYRTMTNFEKDRAHSRLLHSTATAQSIYNKV